MILTQISNSKTENSDGKPDVPFRHMQISAFQKKESGVMKLLFFILQVYRISFQGAFKLNLFYLSFLILHWENGIMTSPNILHSCTRLMTAKGSV
jgi:hypothetical protein